MNNDFMVELLKAQDDLQDITFTFAGKEYKWYFKYLTLLQKVRIEQMAIKVNRTIEQDGSTTTKHEKQDHLVPIHTIIEKALDKDGNRIFSHTVKDDFKTISLMPAGLASLLAYEMSKDIFGTLSPKAEDGK